jgi:AraC-like DNA-binding protein
MDYIKRVDPRFSHDRVTERKITQAHIHDLHELYYLVRGNTKYFVGDEIFYLSKGDMIFVHKEVIHRTDSEESSYNERILLSFDDFVFDSEMEEVVSELSQKKLISFSESKMYVIEDLLKKIEKEYTNNDRYKNALIKSYIRELLILVLRFKDERKGNETDKVMKSISGYISENYYDNLSLEFLSKEFSMSQGHLSRKFKQIIGMGVSEYINYIRVLNAERMLKESDLSITKIAEYCGFNDSNYFSTVFKKVLGVTPYKSRQGHRRSPDV